MAAYENMWVTLTLMLFFINGMFIFVGTLPGSPLSDSNLLLGLTQEEVDKLQGQLSGVYQDTNLLDNNVSDINNLVTASGSTKTYLTLFQTWLFGVLDSATFGAASSAIGGISLLGNILTTGGAMFFGYLLWIDLLIPPYTVGFFFIGAAIKSMLFFIQALGVFDLIFRVFLGGTGTR